MSKYRRSQEVFFKCLKRYYSAKSELEGAYFLTALYALKELSK